MACQGWEHSLPTTWPRCLSLTFVPGLRLTVRLGAGRYSIPPTTMVPSVNSSINILSAFRSHVACDYAFTLVNTIIWILHLQRATYHNSKCMIIEGSSSCKICTPLQIIATQHDILPSTSIFVF